MIRSPLSALRAAALGTAALSLAAAAGYGQAPIKKPTAAPPAPSKPTPVDAVDSTTVGLCNGKKITWGEFVKQLQVDAPDLLNQSLSAVIGQKAAAEMFGATPKDTFTITKRQAMAALLERPNAQLSQQLQLQLTQMAVNDSASRANVQPTQKQVDDKIAKLFADLRKNNTIPAGQSNEMFLQEHKVTMARLKSNYRPQCQVINLINHDLTVKLGHPVGPDDMIQASHILVRPKDLPPTATAEDKAKSDAEALVKIKGLLADIRANKISFADSAKANSEDPGSKDKGGDLGIFMRGMMLKEFENATFAAKVNTVTEPVKSDAGYHIILVTRLGKDIPVTERKEFVDRYEEEQIRGYLQKVVEKDNKVENKLAARVPPPAGGQGMGPGRPGQRLQ